jgi:hypothetical protein
MRGKRPAAPLGPVEQRYQIGAGDYRLFVRGHQSTGWQVWLDETQDFDGVQLGSGVSREAAISKALELLLESVRCLRAHHGN